ncbi:MAG TPA: B12-binding domain-containing radical SAM protein [Candidatus Pacearchaeota archaeon]|nr:radical SAM superfamily protein [archaeon BMS3Abin17]HDK41906.1 B12-binding domain-containing radical SAM protein [Candidatus Pacearchaeota archaeon]HDZ61231.1 B12-binding domain-containing radical SAM protein [Candidatus Pacearchaeota archaeon]
MKITLISTSTYPSDQGIRTISSVLKKAGHDVKIAFMTLSEDYSKNYNLSELSQLMKLCSGSEFIGVNSFASTSKRASRIISFLKKRLNVPILYGGVHATISPEDCIKDSDIVCVGEGEGAVLDFAEAIQKKKKIDKIKNLWIRKEGKIIKNPVRDLVDDLDNLPLPDYDVQDHYLLENGKIRKFTEYDLGGQIFFLTGRGCPYGCDYCSNSLFNELYEGRRKKILRWNSPEYIIKGILFLKERFSSLGYFDIRDDTFSLRSLEDIKKFCELYKEKVKMRFKCLGDPKTITDEKIKLLLDAGCTDIIIGIQGSERVNREIYHRNQKDEYVLRAAQILNKYKGKIAVMYDVITSNPYEQPEDTVDMIRLLQKIPKPYYLSVNNLVFFNGSKLYERAKADGIIKTEKDSAISLNYWDRSAHILLKKKNKYLVLILNLMRGVATENRFGFMPNFLINYLLKPERIRRNLRNESPTLMALKLVSVFDLIREKIAKPFYRSLPLRFRIWYDRARYRV